MPSVPTHLPRVFCVKLSSHCDMFVNVRLKPRRRPQLCLKEGRDFLEKLNTANHQERGSPRTGQGQWALLARLGLLVSKLHSLRCVLRACRTARHHPLWDPPLQTLLHHSQKKSHSVPEQTGRHARCSPHTLINIVSPPQTTHLWCSRNEHIF